MEPHAPDWAGGLREAWTPGEAGAAAALEHFLAGPLAGYGEDRNRPDLASTSRLSPHLRFGEIGPRQVWHATRSAVESGAATAPESDAEKFLSEIGWRSFPTTSSSTIPNSRRATTIRASTPSPGAMTTPP